VHPAPPPIDPISCPEPPCSMSLKRKDYPGLSAVEKRDIVNSNGM